MLGTLMLAPPWAVPGRLVLIMVRRPADSIGCVVQPRRWMIERSLGWLGRWHWLPAP